MNQQSKESTARLLRGWADQVERGVIDWVWIAVQSNQGRLTFATKGAPNRPQGLSK